MIGGAKGIGIGLDFGIGNIKRPTKRDTLDPAIKEALCGVWIADQNTNESPTRNIIKNKLKDRGGDFEILNAAYKGNSGYGKYDTDFTGWNKSNGVSSTQTVINTTSQYNTNWVAYLQANVILPTFKVKISGIPKGGRLSFISNGLIPVIELVNGVNQINGEGKTTIAWTGFNRIVDNLDWTNLVIEQIPYYQGAFCTDGVDDMIVSKKPVGEMLGDSNEITVVSMIHQIAPRNSSNGAINNQIRPNNTFIRNNVATSGKMGIYGYAISKVNDPLYNNKVVSNILGDKNDYTFNSTVDAKIDGKFSVEGYQNNNNNIDEVSQVAWYWTLIAKRVLTTDEINQVIAYYNLDKYVAPDIYYDVKKQGLTNENHTEFGDKLIDYSGNGKDMQLYDFGWKLDSGVGKYEEDFTAWSYYSNELYRTPYRVIIETTEAINPVGFITWKGVISTNSFKVRVTGIPKGKILRYIYKTGELPYVSNFDITENNKVYELPASDGFSGGHGFTITATPEERKEWVGLVIEQLPSYENALVSDGVSDYGQYVGDLGLKDYTVVADRAYVELTYRQIPFVSSNKIETNTPFILEYSVDLETYTNPCSYGNRHSVAKPIDKNRKVSYQSTYVYNGNAITKGTSTNTGDGLTFGRYGDNAQYAKLCLYNFMLFPYSLSEFLIERQLKKRKLGTLHPNMVEFRPIVKSNIEYSRIDFFDANWVKIMPGDYMEIGSIIKANLYLPDNTYEVTSITLNGENILFKPSASVDAAYNITSTPITKSPQKINITIDEYILFEDIGQTYPIAVDIYNAETDYKYTYGDKLLIGSPIKLKVVNLLPELYSSPRNKLYRFDDNLGLIIREDTTYYVGKNMSFVGNGKYLFGDNKPKVIYSPEKYPISNEGLKILGYLPDLSGNENHGKLNSFFFTGNYDVITNGAIQFGTSSSSGGGYTHITIPTVKNGCKQMMTKIKWVIKDNMSNLYIYDHSGSTYKAGKSTYIRENADEDIAYFGTIKTYLDGKLNTSIKAKTLAGVTHNITSILNSDSAAEIYIGKNGKDVMATDELKGGIYSLMLFDEIDNDETIMKLNEAIGIENNQQGGGGRTDG